MKIFVICALVIALGWSQGEENARPVLAQDAPLQPPAGKEVKRPAKSAEPWIGVSVEKPEAPLIAHLAGIPRGVGFTIKEIDPAGPAAMAGIRPYDYVWKLDDQLLINEGQFIALLGLREVGEKVLLTYQRRGKNREAEVVLASRPASANGKSEVERIVTMPPFPGMPQLVISDQERYAELEDGAGVVKVKRGSEKFHWMAWNDEGENVGRGRIDFPDERGQLELPENLDPVLKNKLSALIRAYEHAAGRGRSSTRLPRVRRVPTPVEDLRR